MKGILCSRAPQEASGHDDGILLGGTAVVRKQGVGEAQAVPLHQSCGQHCDVRHRGVLPVKSTILSAHVVHGRQHAGRAQGEVRTTTNKEVLPQSLGASVVVVR